MKILVFVEIFMSPTILFIYNEINELSKDNEVLLLTTKRVKENEKKYPFENISIIPFNPTKAALKASWLLEKYDIYFTRKNNAFGKNVEALISSFKPDVIHAHFGYESLILLENIKNPPCPVFVSFHGYDATQMIHRKCYVKKLNHYFDNFNVTPIYVSNYMRNEMENAGIHLKNGKLLYYGTDIDFFKPAVTTSTHDKFTFLQISSFIEKKGHTYTLQAFKKFLDSVQDKRRYKLILAGGGPMLEEIKNQTSNIGLSDFVEFTGFIAHKETLALLQQADVFVHHSIISSKGMKEGIPNTLMEAMAMELPIISTLHAGIPELVEEGINGYLVKEKDVDAYAQRMKDILTWKHLPANRQKVKDLFSYATHKRNLMKIYQDGISSIK